MQEARAAIDLIERAFGLARQAGKSSWWAMTIPVLKNRLLQLTKNTFKEADFGAISFRDFLSKFPDIVRVDETPPPGFVILKSAVEERSERPPEDVFRGGQIRADLWRAVLDYSNGNRYVWDTSDFVALHRPQTVEVAERVEEWCRNRLPTAALPAPMRPAWNKYLKGKVEQRLQHWFKSNSIKAPAIMEERREPVPSRQQVEALREFIIGCVKTMPEKELLELRISPVTAMRTLQAQKSSVENER